MVTFFGQDGSYKLSDVVVVIDDKDAGHRPRLALAEDRLELGQQIRSVLLLFPLGF